MDKMNRLKGKKVLLIDPDKKKENDKTFCFWATEQDDIYQDFKKIISTQWSKVQINNNFPESILPLSYFHINSIDLYNYSREIITKYNVICLSECVSEIYEKETLLVETSNNTYRSKYVFDSRINKIKKPIEDKYYISQSFYGFKIELLEQFFEDDVYRMMDFRVSQSGATQFVYILPYSSKTGLVELTRFGKKIIEIKEAEDLLNKFIEDNFGGFKIIETERGVIPMDPVLPKQSRTENWVSIGTRAGNVKPSTGYAFKNMYNQSKVICNSDTFDSKKQVRKRRFHFYDQLLLIILTVWPDKGRSIFEQLFRVKKSAFVLKFLDEKSSPIEEFKMFFKLQIVVFLKATLYWANWKWKPYLMPLLMISAIFMPAESLINSDLEISNFQVVILVIGLLIVGIPHGALDHFTNAIDKGKKNHI
jgi:lycopene beta-cyclase